MRPRTILVALLAALCCAWGGGAWLAVAHADTGSPSPSPSATVSPSPTPSPSVSPTPAPASADLVAWCLRWHRLAGRDRARLGRLRACLGRGRLRALPGRPSSDAASEWSAYGHRLKRLAHRWAAERPRDLHAILCPKDVSVASWKPCVRYFWPADEVGNCLICISRESGGRSWAVGPGGACVGLMQEAECWACKWHYDRTCGWQNIKYGYEIWLDCGWSAWVTM